MGGNRFSIATSSATPVYPSASTTSMAHSVSVSNSRLWSSLRRPRARGALTSLRGRAAGGYAGSSKMKQPQFGPLVTTVSHVPDAGKTRPVG